MPRTNDPPTDPRELRRALRHLGALREDEIAIPDAGQPARVLRPVETDRLLDLAADDPEQNLPYWAELWPSGIALAAAITAHPHLASGKRALELGCGLGVTAMSALAAGADLTITDYAPDALTLATLNCLRHVNRAPATRQLNWRSPDPAFTAFIGPGFPVVLAADVLYEARDIAPLAALASRVVAPGGVLWLAEPGRRPARAFLAAMAAQGWRDDTRRYDGPWPDPKDAGVVVTVHLLRRPLDNDGQDGT